VEVLSSRILLRPVDLSRSHRFYRDILGLAVYREFGPPASPSVVFFLNSGFLEVSGHAEGTPGQTLMIWLQVRDLTLTIQPTRYLGSIRLSALIARALRSNRRDLSATGRCFTS
jgi:predicted enzyme related to lactoylglutathione lyase